MSTPGNAAHWTGDEHARSARRSARQDRHTRLRPQPARGLGARVVDLAGDIWPGVLRDRDDGGRRVALRHGPLRVRAVSRLATPGGPDDRRRPRGAEDGASPARGLRPDARTEVGHRHGRLRVVHRRLQQLRAGAGRRQDRAGRRLRARLPADAGRTARFAHQAQAARGGRQSLGASWCPDDRRRGHPPRRHIGANHALMALANGAREVRPKTLSLPNRITATLLLTDWPRNAATEIPSHSSQLSAAFLGAVFGPEAISLPADGIPTVLVPLTELPDPAR